MNRVSVPLGIVIFLSCLGATCANSCAQIPSNLMQATVEISVQEKKGENFRHSGTGWYGEGNQIVTAKHVVDGYDAEITGKSKHFDYNAVRITFDNGQQIILSKINFNKSVDIAIIPFDVNLLKAPHQPLKIASSKAAVGDKLFGAGFPYDYECLLLTGYVTGYHFGKEEPFLGEYLVTNAMFNPGNSGGPVVNEQGDIIGMVDYIDQRSPAFSFAITSETIKKALDKMK